MHGALDRHLFALLHLKTDSNKGMKATTHWRWADALQQLYSDVQVNPNPIFIKNDFIKIAELQINHSIAKSGEYARRPNRGM